MENLPLESVISIALRTTGSDGSYLRPSSPKEPPSEGPIPLICTAWEITSLLYSGCLCSRRKLASLLISSSEAKAPWIRRGLPIISVVSISISPLPSSFSAPLVSSIIRESIPFNTLKAIRPGMFALIRPVTTFTSGRWVASTKCIPAARPFWAIRTISCSRSLPACIIKSAISSIIITM